MNVHHVSAHGTEQFGIHIMIDGYAAAGPAMTDKAALRRLLGALADEMGMHPICEPVVVSVGSNCKKDPGGLSGFVMIAESHISFHTFPARGFVTIDLYTCQTDLDRAATIARLRRAFRIVDADIYVQDRGIRYPSQDLSVGPDALQTETAGQPGAG
ncbi:MAG: S-adenosylmethionine decarboxylase [Pseudomonadota bacterium]